MHSLPNLTSPPLLCRGLCSCPGASAKPDYRREEGTARPLPLPHCAEAAWRVPGIRTSWMSAF
eukprot:9995060-Alexandrium_andersonii.AAC.1